MRVMQAAIFITMLVLGALAIVAALAWKVRREGIGLKVAVHGESVLRPVDCEHCSGGAQALVDPDLGEGGWGPIPRSMRMVEPRNSPFIEPPYGSTRSCSYCRGIGFTWAEVPVNHDYIPPGTAMVRHFQKRWEWPWE